MYCKSVNQKRKVTSDGDGPRSLVTLCGIASHLRLGEARASYISLSLFGYRGRLAILLQLRSRDMDQIPLLNLNFFGGTDTARTSYSHPSLQRRPPRQRQTVNDSAPAVLISELLLR
jgi:hypothetical protein